jgi:heme exporter protein A
MVNSEQQQTMFSVENASIMRGNSLILRDFSLLAKAGQIVWLRGSNGSGKTTLLRCIAGLLPYAAGTLIVKGSMSMADENLALDGSTVLEAALEFWRKLDGTDPANLEKAIKSFDLLGLTEMPVRFLSTGQRKRAALARVMASQTDIWLLDEPYNGLDDANMKRLDNAIMAHTANGGIAVVAAHRSPDIKVDKRVTIGKPESGNAEMPA